jgi:hypothetical protein
MYAVFVQATIDPERADEALAQLRSDVVPRVKQVPGFVAGYWTRTEGGGRSCLVFESEGAAQQVIEMIRTQPTPTGVTIDSAVAAEVVASA